MRKNANIVPDEAERLEREERRTQGRRRALLYAFALLMGGAIAGAYFARGASFAPVWALATPAPSPSPSAMPASSPSPGAAKDTPGPSPDDTKPFSPTAIYVDGALAGVIASREAAEALLADVSSYFQMKVDGIGVLVTSVESEIELKDAPPDEIAGLSTYETLFARFTAEDTPLTVVTLLSSESFSAVSCETKTETTKYLLRGTRLIASMGRDGSTHTVSVSRYVNGKPDGKPEEVSASVVAPVDAVVFEGTKAVDKDAEPGKSEGQKGPDAGELSFIRPARGADIVVNFGQYRGAMHLGLDFDVAEGDPVLAACAGVVVCAMERGGYGLMIEIDHGNGFVTRYAHLQSAAVELGQTVVQGDVIGAAGMSGNCKKPVLHFELRVDGIAYNPRFYLD